MKKVFVWGICLGLSMAVGCKKDKGGPLNPLGCAANANKVVEATTRWGEDPSIANCEAYKKEAIAFIKSCPTFYSGVQKEQIEEISNMACE